MNSIDLRSSYLCIDSSLIQYTLCFYMVDTFLHNTFDYVSEDDFILVFQGRWGFVERLIKKGSTANKNKICIVVVVC